jgi:hypothetical protein
MVGVSVPSQGVFLVPILAGGPGLGRASRQARSQAPAPGRAARAARVDSNVDTTHPFLHWIKPNSAP